MKTLPLKIQFDNLVKLIFTNELAQFSLVKFYIS